MGITHTWLPSLVHCILNRLGIPGDTLSTSAFWLMSPLDTDKSKFLGSQSRAWSSIKDQPVGCRLALGPLTFPASLHLITTGFTSASSIWLSWVSSWKSDYFWDKEKIYLFTLTSRSKSWNVVTWGKWLPDCFPLISSSISLTSSWNMRLLMKKYKRRY